MPRVVFTSNLQRHVAIPDRDVAGTTVAQALAVVFADAPQARDYVLDEQGHVRKHVFIFVDGQRITERERLEQPLGESSQVYVMQALTGG